MEYYQVKIFGGDWMTVNRTDQPYLVADIFERDVFRWQEAQSQTIDPKRTVVLVKKEG